MVLPVTTLIAIRPEHLLCSCLFARDSPQFTNAIHSHHTSFTNAITITRLLILIKVSDVDVFGPHAQMIASSQGTEQMVISGHRYFRLKATIEDDQYHINARGEGLRYTQSTFEDDFKTAKGEFSV